MKRTDIQRKLLIVLAVVLSVTAVACVLIGTKQKRKQFVGLIDTERGYRCRFTVASDWDCDDTGFSHSVKWLDNYSFSPPPPSPMMHWIKSHLFRQSDSTPLEIHLFSTAATHGNEYPLMNETGILHQRHLRIDGYPATTYFDEDMLVGGRITISLLVYAPECEYEITGEATSQDKNELDREMQAIISSFHVERVAVRAASGEKAEEGADHD